MFLLMEPQPVMLRQNGWHGWIWLVKQVVVVLLSGKKDDVMSHWQWHRDGTPYHDGVFQ